MYMIINIIVYCQSKALTINKIVNARYLNRRLLVI